MARMVKCRDATTCRNEECVHSKPHAPNTNTDNGKTCTVSGYCDVVDKCVRCVTVKR